MKKARQLLVVIPSDHYGRNVLLGIYAYCRTHGTWDLHVEGDQHPDLLGRTRFALEHWKADGIIASVSSTQMERLIHRSGVPAVNMSVYYAAKMPTVISDGVALGRKVARYFLDNGCRNFAYCSRTIEPGPRSRCDGFLAELRKAGYSCEVFSDHFVGYLETDWVQNRKRMDEWLLGLQKPVAMMCSHELKGREVSWACQRLDLRVPEDVALLSVGHDDVLCRVLTPPLSTIEANPEKIGFEAVRLLDRITRNGKIGQQPILIPPGRLSARRSSDIVSVDDPEIASAVRYLRDHMDEPLTVKDLLREVPISRRALERRFEKAMGRTPKAEIMRLRINLAKELLADTDLRGSTISTKVGFTSPEKFSAVFRRKTGQTPTEYRRSCRIGVG